MMITRQALPRRTFLRGVGATLALPLLDAMVPALTAVSKTPAAGARRLGFVYIPNGANMAYWTPQTTGAGFELSPILAPLAPLRDRLTGASVEDLLERRGAVLADVAGLRREDDERLAVGRHDDVGIAVHDLEAGQVRDRPLEAGVLAARDDEGVEPVLRHRRPYVRIASRELGF